MTPVEENGRARRALNRLRKPRGGGLEAPGPAAPDLTDDRIKTSLDAALERFRKIAERTKSGGDEVTQEQKRVLDDAEEALKRLAVDGENATLSNRHVIGLEAIVIPDGTRPALFIQEDDINPGVPQAGSWATRIMTMRDRIGDVASSVGRINSAIGFPDYAGTGFVVADGLILTNKHVLESLAVGQDVQADGTWKFQHPVTIDFAAEYESRRTKSFNVTGVKYASPDRIGDVLNISNLDVALLEVEKTNGNGEALPPPLTFSTRMNAIGTQSDVYVMGYPARPHDEVGKVLMVVFQDEYFVKRFAPGYVEQRPDDVDDGGHQRVFTHDASTLHGNSGSCVIEFRIEGRAVVGLHFGGRRLAENYAHSIARIKAVLTDCGVVVQDQ